MSKEESAEEDRQVEMWKVKKLIKSLQAARGYVTLPWFVANRLVVKSISNFI